MRRPIVLVTAAAFTVAALCLTFAQDSRTPAPPNKTSAALRSAATSAGRLQVFILLKDQPHRQIVAEVDQFYRADRESAQGHYQQESGTGPGGRARLLEARRHLDEILLQSRREAMDRIEFRLRPQRDAMAAHLGSLGATRIKAYQTVNLFRAEIPASALPFLESHPDIAAVFPIGVQTGELNVSVPATGAPKFWGYGWTGAGETVGVLDTGVTPHVAFPAGGLINPASPFLGSGTLQPGFADANVTTDMVGHGTLVAGVILSAGGTAACPNCVGMTKGTGAVLNLKTGYKLASGGGFSDGFQQDDVIDAFDWAFVNHPEVKVFNFSAGHPAPAAADDDNFSNLLDYLADAYGVTIVATAGNANNSTAPANQLSTPGIGYNLITVANADATGATPVIAPTSSLGPVLASHRSKPDIAAPGIRIASTSMDGTSFEQSDGSSIAAPHIAGAAALIRSAGVSDSLAIKALLLNSANGNTGWKRDMGWGFVDLSTLADLLNTAKQSGRDAYVSGSLQMSNVNAFQLFRLKPFLPRKATLVWNRHFNTSLQPVLNQLNLFAYELNANQNSIADTTTAPVVDNVKQLPGLPGDDLVLKVKTTNPAQPAGTLEPLALAVSNGALSLLNGPTLSLSCLVQTSQTEVPTVPVNCTAAISGDAPVSNVTAVSDDGQTIAYGNMDPSSLSTQSIIRTIHATTPSSSTPVTHTVTMTGQAFGETFTVVSTFTVSQSDGDGSGGGGGGGQGSCQQGAQIGVDPTQITLGTGANSGSFGVQAPAGCKWTAGTYSGPVEVTSGTSGSGPGAVIFQVFPQGFGGGTPFAAAIMVIFDLGPNAPPQARERAVAIQLSPSTCSFTVPSTVSVAASGPSGTVTGTVPVTASASSANCQWGAYSTTSWITFTTASGTGGGAATMVAQNNPSSKPRTGAVMVANKPVSVAQPGVPCTYTLNPSSSGVLSALTSLGGTFTVTAPNDCAWTPKPSMPWIEILNVKYTGTNGGNGVVTYGVAENFTTTVAHGTIAVGTATYNVTQPATTPCTLSYPETINVDAWENKGQLDLKAPVGCVWRLPATPAWIHLSLNKPSAAPSGSQVVLYTVDPNTDNANGPAVDRSAKVGATTFHQAPFTVTTKSVHMGALGGKSNIVMQGPANLPLNVLLLNGVDWITVQAPQTSLNGHLTRYTLAITVNPNLTPGTRSTPVKLTLTGGTSQNPRTTISVPITQDGTP